MKTKKSNILTLKQFKDKNYGKRGTAKRDELEAGYENFLIGALIHEARLEKGLTQAEIAKRINTKQSVISRVENAKTVPSLSFLKRLALVLNASLQVQFKSQ